MCIRDSISPPTKTWTYTYDSANRLETANDGTLHTYTYDANGNRAGSTVDAQDRVTSQTDNGITTTYTYDAHGNVQVRTVTNLPTQSFTWDSEGSLLSSTQPSATVTYVIDALGRRVGRKVGGVLNREWVYDGQLRIVGEYIGATKVRLYGYLPERHLPVMMVEKDGATTKTYRIYGDHLGSLRAVVDVATGNAVQVMQHDPWGKATTDTLSGGFVRVPFGFAGGIYDEDTKLVRFGAREYDPETGRWLSKDEARFGGGPNFYEYAGGDPVNFIDPNGRVSIPAPLRGGGLFPWWMGPDVHRCRNTRQDCPASAPEEPHPDALVCGGSDWVRDDRGAHDAATYRGMAEWNHGYQCSYDANGKLSNDGVRRGSYDYSPPDQDFLAHLLWDVAPVYLFGTGYCEALGDTGGMPWVGGVPPFGPTWMPLDD